jgi:hypothetical protein
MARGIRASVAARWRAMAKSALRMMRYVAKTRRLCARKAQLCDKRAAALSRAAMFAYRF